MGRLNLTNARLIDGTGSQARDGMTLVIDDGRITEVWSEPPQPDLAQQQPLDNAPNNLSDPERQVLTLRYGLGGGRPLSPHDVAVRLGITMERLRQIETGILRRTPDIPGLPSQSPSPQSNTEETIDLQGRTLLPGLINAHCHIMMDASADPFALLGRLTPAPAVR